MMTMLELRDLKGTNQKIELLTEPGHPEESRVWVFGAWFKATDVHRMLTALISTQGALEMQAPLDLMRDRLRQAERDRDVAKAELKNRKQWCACKELQCDTCTTEQSAPYDEGDACACGGQFRLHGVYAVAAARESERDVERARAEQAEKRVADLLRRSS